MTRKELAAFKRLNKRRDRLFMALSVIKTWLSFPNDKDTLYHIGKLATERIEEERAAMAEEFPEHLRIRQVPWAKEGENK